MNTELESITMGGKYNVGASEKLPYAYRNSTTDKVERADADPYIAVSKEETTSPNKNHAITEKELMAAVGATSVISIYSSTNNESIPNDSTSAEQNS